MSRHIPDLRYAYLVSYDVSSLIPSHEATHYASAVALPSSLENTVPPPQTTLASSLEALTSVLSENASKIFYLQISDGAFVDPSTLSKKAADQGIHALYAWSNEYRPLPFQGGALGGFLPVMSVISAVLKTGWRGPWSYEVRFTSFFVWLSESHLCL